MPPKISLLDTQQLKRFVVACAPPPPFSLGNTSGSWWAKLASQLGYYLSAGIRPTVAALPVVLSIALPHHLELSLHFMSTDALQKETEPENVTNGIHMAAGPKNQLEAPRRSLLQFQQKIMHKKKLKGVKEMQEIIVNYTTAKVWSHSAEKQQKKDLHGNRRVRRKLWSLCKTLSHS